MEIVYAAEALEDLQWWKASGNKKVQHKISELLANILEHPTTGIGKPEVLKHQYSGLWSRRINREHRLVYKIDGTVINVLSLKGHYE